MAALGWEVACPFDNSKLHQSYSDIDLYARLLAVGLHIPSIQLLATYRNSRTRHFLREPAGSLEPIRGEN